MAIVPLSATNIRFLSGIPFTNDYKNTRWFDTITEQTNYFLNKVPIHSLIEANFQRIEGKNFVSVNKSIDELWNINYLMFQNSQYNNKWFYAFVTKLEYVQKNTTYVHFQIDVFQTWKFEMNFKPSFVIREHCDLWNADGTPIINTLDEGLNYGTEYDIVDSQHFNPPNDIFFLVIVSKSTLHAIDHDGDVGTPPLENQIKASKNGLPQPLNYYVHPFRLDGTLPNSTELTDIITTLTSIFTQENAVNNVVSLYVTEYIGLSLYYDSVNDKLDFNPDIFERVYISDNVHPNIVTMYVKNFETYSGDYQNCGNKYSGFKTVKESKLLMYPYSLTILDDFKGNRIELKNEYINNTDLIVKRKGSLGTTNKVAYHVPDYLAESNVDVDHVTIESGMINNNPQDIPIITDMLSAYLQGNKNTLENQKSSMMFNGVMNGVGNAIGGVASGMMGNPIGVVSAGTNIIQGAGQTVLQIQGLQAKKQDISNVPPQLVKMGSNSAFDYGNGYSGFYVIKKQIKPEYIKKLEDFFNMFGYKVNEVKVPNFHTRQYWNYVQTSSCNILGNFNNEDLQELKQIFDNGITLWHTDDVGNYSLNNGVI